MKYSIKNGLEGSELLNAVPTPQGGVRVIEAFTNAVIVTMFEGEPDPDTREPRYVRAISLMVRDRDMEEPLREEAKRILQQTI